MDEATLTWVIEISDLVMHVDAITRRLNHLGDFVQVAMGTYQALVNEAHGHNLDIKSIKRRLELGMNATESKCGLCQHGPRKCQGQSAALSGRLTK